MYTLRLLAPVYTERQKLPGMMRQRLKDSFSQLTQDPRPHNSVELRLIEDFPLEVRRLRVEKWRVLYTIDPEFAEITILAIRKRPPYDYQDLAELLSQLD
jgi:mRNA-degrading endonuclease RelE of RelBE toxin-antitoxin system